MSPAGVDVEITAEGDLDRLERLLDVLGFDDLVAPAPEKASSG